jgi:hypothetical protein
VNSIWHYSASGKHAHHITGLTRPQAEERFETLKETVDAHKGSGIKLLSTKGEVLSHYKGKRYKDEKRA